MSRWVAVPVPSAILYPEEAPPRKSPDGTEVQIFFTKYGKRFARVVEPNGFVMWQQEMFDR